MLSKFLFLIISSFEPISFKVILPSCVKPGRHLLCLLRMDIIGIKNNMLMFIRAVLQPNMVQVKDGPFLSKWIVQHDGVPQGDKLSPLLLSIFIADREPILSKKNVTLSDLTYIQEALQSLEVYCEDNLMSVKVEKTKAGKFRNRGRLITASEFEILNDVTQF